MRTTARRVHDSLMDERREARKGKLRSIPVSKTDEELDKERKLELKNKLKGKIALLQSQRTYGVSGRG